MSKTVVHENPLVPNAKLRQMYVAMAEARVLDEHIAGLQRRVKAQRKLESTHGQEACRVSMTIDLTAGDLVIDSQAGVGLDLIAGEKVAFLLKRVGEYHAGKKSKTAKREGAQRVMPWIEDAGDRLRMAMGAALSFKTLGRKNVVVVFVRHAEVEKGAWRQVVELAGRFELPVIFVVLPPAKGEKAGRGWNLSAKASSWGVPGMPVDAEDAVALYRVAQESLGRTRAGDGPVLIECVSFRVAGSEADPVEQMKEFLLGRKMSTKTWLEGAGGRLRRKIAAAQ